MPTSSVLSRSRTKQAYLGGDGQDVPFEQAFSNLAHAYLQDKAPSLLDHEQGFQLLDRNQENTKAIGVFGFKVGSNQLYAPVFFLQGDLKGHELLYLKNQDLFVPLKENWLNYLLNRKPHILGEGTGRNTSQLGVMAPDFSRMKLPYKQSSAMPPWAQPFVVKYASLIAEGAFEETLNELERHCQERLNLGDFVKMASSRQLEVLVKHLQLFPEVAQRFDEYHGMDLLRQSIKTACEREKIASVLDPVKPVRRVPTYHVGSVLEEKQAAKKDGPQQKIKVLTYDTTLIQGLPEGIDEDDQEKLLKDKVLIKDDRGDDEVSVPYNVQTEKKLFNPQETGLYYILTKPGDMEKCFVVVNPHGPNGRKSFATIVRIGDTHNWINAYPTEIWAGSKIEGEEYDKWFDGLPEANSLSTSESRTVLVGPRGNATLPFKVEKKIEKSGDDAVYEVYFDMYCEAPPGRNALRGLGRYEYEDSSDSYSEWRDGQRVHLNGKDGTSLRSSRGDLWVPKGYKKLSAEKSKEDAKPEKEEHDPCVPVACGPCGMGSSSKIPPIRPGNLVDAEMALFTKTAGLKIAHNGTEVWINDSAPLTPITALISLVREHGFREDVSRHMLKQASAKRVLRVRVKYAFGGGGSPYMIDSAPSAPSFPEPDRGGGNPMGFQGQTQNFQQEDIPVSGMDPSAYDHSGYDIRPEATTPQMDQQQIGRAMESGQKEIFDTAMIGSMLKSVRDDTMIDKYLPDLIKGMDRKGRVLFQFYAHGDKFADRYGKQDMPELEDSLRNAFEMDGDVVLFLKQKTIEPYPEQANSVSLDLEDGNS